MFIQCQPRAPIWIFPSTRNFRTRNRLLHDCGLGGWVAMPALTVNWSLGADWSSNLYWRASIHRYINVGTVLGNPFSNGSSAVSERMDLRRHRDRGRPAYWLAVVSPVTSGAGYTKWPGMNQVGMAIRQEPIYRSKPTNSNTGHAATVYRGHEQSTWYRRLPHGSPQTVYDPQI